LIRAAALKAIGGFDATLWGADDWDLYIRLAGQGDFVYKHRPALFYRFHHGNASKNTRRMYQNSCRVQYKHLGRVPKPRNLRLWRACRRFIIGFTTFHYLNEADQFKAEGSKQKVRRQWLEIVWIDPGILRNRVHLRQFLSALFLLPDRKSDTL
jgi:GT2 family glycosyltransferase